MFRGTTKATKISVAAASINLEFEEKTQSKCQGQQETFEPRNPSSFECTRNEQNGPQLPLTQTDDRAQLSKELVLTKPSLRTKDYCVLLVLVIALFVCCAANLIVTLYLHASCTCNDSSTGKGKLVIDMF
jgi:hypothetical protein